MSRIVDRDVKKSIPHQNKFASDLSDRYNCTFLDRDEYNQIDYDIIRGGEIVAYAELKNRQHDYGRFPTLFIDESKLDALRENSTATGNPNFLFVRYLNGDYYYEVTADEKFKVEKGGRTTHTREPNDIDYVEHIPINKFKPSKD